MRVELQVDKHYVSVETGYKPADSSGLFRRMIEEAIKKMDYIISKGDTDGSK